MDCADIFRVRISSRGIIDTSEKHCRGLFDSTLISVEDKSMFMGDSHEFVEMFVMFLVILSMNNYIICDANHSIAADKDLIPSCWKMCCGQARPARGGRQI